MKLNAESITLDGDSIYEPLMVSPSTGVKLTFKPACIISQGTDGYVLDGQSIVSDTNVFLIFFS